MSKGSYTITHPKVAPFPATPGKEHERWLLLPIQHHQLWAMYKKHQEAFWTTEEIDLANDVRQWQTQLSDAERHFISHVLAFFAASDGIVNENLATRFMAEVPLAEARCFYGWQIAMENIHSETYALLIDTYISDDAGEKTRLRNAIVTMPCVQRKAEWALQWIDGERKDAAFGMRLLAFAVVEGIFFSGSFCAIFWLKKRNLMPGLTFSNELISRDEGLHCEFAVALYNMLAPADKPPMNDIVTMVRDAVSIELEFICEALSVAVIGMNAELMSQYIHFVADYWLRRFGAPDTALYGAENPFPWMELLSLQGKTNFFEARVGDYAKVSGALARSKDGVEQGGPRIFSTNEDF